MTHEPKVGELPARPKVIDPPETIYLQTGGLDDALRDFAFAELDGVTWCSDRIDDDDIEYVRADPVAAEREARKDEARIERLIEAIEGECEGLGIDDRTARAILHYVETGEPPPACEHEWADARNRVILSGEVCLKCWVMRTGNAALQAEQREARPEGS